MYEKMRLLMQWHSDLMNTGRFEDLAREYRLPMVIYRGAIQLVVHDVDQLVAYFKECLSARRARGVMDVRIVVTAVDLPRNGRFRVWLQHHERDALGVVVAQVDVIQYLRESNQDLLCEMVECFEDHAVIACAA